MTIYFGIIMMSGMFGIRYEDLPAGLQKIALLLPTTFIAKDFINFWQGGSYNFAPIVQAFIFTISVSVIFLLGVLYYNNRKIKQSIC